MVIHQHDLTLGLPHTNHRGWAEHLLMMQAGHVQWNSIATSVGRPLSTLRTMGGGEVYATFYFIDECIPDRAPLESFKLDDRVRFAVWLRAFKGTAVEGQVLFDREDRLAPALDGLTGPCPDRLKTAHPFIRFANIFITPEAGNSRLRVAPPANADFSGLEILPDDENPYHLTRQAETTGELGLLDDGWTPIDGAAPGGWTQAIDADRDTNGAGLVYFANYFAFMEAAERRALAAWRERPFPAGATAARSVRRRRVAYYGNVGLDDTVSTAVSLFVHPDDRRLLGCRHVMRRLGDHAVICRSEAIKVVPA
jgi:probable biosynthetic protein (TIGR04098 family)